MKAQITIREVKCERLEIFLVLMEIKYIFAVYWSFAFRLKMCAPAQVTKWQKNMLVQDSITTV